MPVQTNNLNNMLLKSFRLADGRAVRCQEEEKAGAEKAEPEVVAVVVVVVNSYVAISLTFVITRARTHEHTRAGDTSIFNSSKWFIS